MLELAYRAADALTWTGRVRSRWIMIRNQTEGSPHFE
jgi:hypothetical protein